MTTERTQFYNQDTSDDMALADATFESRRDVAPSHAEAVLRGRMDRTRQLEPSDPSRLKRFVGGAAIIALTGALFGFVGNQVLDALVEKAEHVEQVGNEYLNQPQDGIGYVDDTEIEP